MANQIVVSAGAKVRNLQDVIIGTSGVLTSLGFDVANGVPRLDVNGKILVSQLPNSVMEYKGTWNISTNTPTLVNGTGNQGDVYLVEGAAVGGTAFNFGAGPITFFNGDQAIYSGSIWQRASGATGTVTSVAITESGDSLNITGSPITTSGTINIGFNGTNLQYVNGAGNLTTFPTLITSIGLSMPSAFSVANSPLTANGTIAVTGAGVASQYIRGDGTLADFPSSGGGGSSVSYYLNGGTSQGTIGGVTYYEMSKTAVVGTGVDFSLAGDGLIVSFLTDANDPAQLNIPAGNWNYEIYASMSSNGGTPELYAELYKYDGTTFTLIATSPHEILYDGTALNLYTFAMAVPATSLTLTDRLAIKLYATNSGGKTTTIHTQDSHLCQVITTFSTGITALNGLTAQVQYFQTGTSGTDFNISSTTATHTFNIPDASATARGLITTGTQTIAGTKTFNDATKNNGGIFLQNASSNSLAGYMNLGGLTNGVKFTSGGGVSNTFTLPSATGYDYTFPNGTGTIALTSNLSSYVPYTGATSQVDIDYYTFLAGNIYSRQGSFLLNQTGTRATTAGYTTFASQTASGKYGFIIDNGNTGVNQQLLFNNAASYTFTFPNATGTLALTSDLAAYVPITRTITGLGSISVSGSGDLSANRTISIAQSSVSSDGYLSATDFNTFNNKQGTITLTTTGTSGAATFSSNTLNIPNYAPDLSGYVTLATTQTISGAKTFSTVIKYSGTSQILDASSGTTGYLYQYLANTTGAAYFGLERSTGGGLFTGSSAYATVLGSASATSLEFGTNGIIRLKLDTSGNLGLGVTPSAWALYKAIQVQGASIANYDTSDNSIIGSNVYYGGSPTDFRYISTGTSTMYRLNGGAHSWYNAISGSANAAITFTQAMTLTAAGRLLLGTTTESTYLLDVNGTGRFNGNVEIVGSAYPQLNIIGNSSTSGGGVRMFGSTTQYAEIYGEYESSTNGQMFFRTRRSGTITTALTLASTGAATFSSSVSATSFFEVSDKTQKTLIQDNVIINGIENILAKTYIKDNKEEIGYFAQDLQGVLDSSINMGENGLLSLSYRQVHTAKISSLEFRVKELEKKLMKYEA